MLHVSVSTVRLFLHVLAATVWVGGQITLAGLVPGARQISPSAPRELGRRFALIAWPAFGVLIATGIWNIVAVHPTWSGAYGVTLVVKIVVVAISGISAFAHGRSRTRPGLAIWGATAGFSAIAALFLGVLLHG